MSLLLCCSALTFSFIYILIMRPSSLNFCNYILSNFFHENSIILSAVADVIVHLLQCLKLVDKINW